MNILKKLFGIKDNAVKQYFKTGLFNKFVATLVTACFVISIVNLPAFADKKKKVDEIIEEDTKAQEVLNGGDKTSDSVRIMQSLADNVDLKENVIWKKGKDGKKEVVGTWDGKVAKIWSGGKFVEDEAYTKAIKAKLGIQSDDDEQATKPEENDTDILAADIELQTATDFFGMLGDNTKNIFENYVQKSPFMAVVGFLVGKIVSFLSNNDNKINNGENELKVSPKDVDRALYNIFKSYIDEDSFTSEVESVTTEPKNEANENQAKVEVKPEEQQVMVKADMQKVVEMVENFLNENPGHVGEAIARKFLEKAKEGFNNDNDGNTFDYKKTKQYQSLSDEQKQAIDNKVNELLSEGSLLERVKAIIAENPQKYPKLNEALQKFEEEEKAKGQSQIQPQIEEEQTNLNKQDDNLQQSQELSNEKGQEYEEKINRTIKLFMDLVKEKQDDSSQEEDQITKEIKQDYGESGYKALKALTDKANSEREEGEPEITLEQVYNEFKKAGVRKQDLDKNKAAETIINQLNSGTEIVNSDAVALAEYTNTSKVMAAIQLIAADVAARVYALNNKAENNIIKTSVSNLSSIASKIVSEIASLVKKEPSIDDKIKQDYGEKNYKTLKAITDKLNSERKDGEPKITLEEVYNIFKEQGVTKEDLEKASEVLLSQISNGARIMNCSAGSLASYLGISEMIAAVQQLSVDIATGTFLMNNKKGDKQIKTSMEAQQKVCEINGKSSKGYKCNFDDFVASLNPGESAIVWVNGDHYITVNKKEDGSFGVTDINVNNGKEVIYSEKEFRKLMNNEKAVGRDAKTGKKVECKGYKATDKNGNVTVLTDSKSVAKKGKELSKEQMKEIAGASHTETVTETVTVHIVETFTVSFTVSVDVEILPGIYISFSFEISFDVTIEYDVEMEVTYEVEVPDEEDLTEEQQQLPEEEKQDLLEELRQQAIEEERQRIQEQIDRDQTPDYIQEQIDAQRQDPNSDFNKKLQEQLNNPNSDIMKQIQEQLANPNSDIMKQIQDRIQEQLKDPSSNLLQQIQKQLPNGVNIDIGNINIKINDINLQNIKVKDDKTLNASQLPDGYTLGKDSGGNQTITDTNGNTVNVKDFNSPADAIKTLQRANELGGTVDSDGNIKLSNDQVISKTDILNDDSYKEIKGLWDEAKNLPNSKDIKLEKPANSNGSWGVSGPGIKGIQTYSDIVNSDRGLKGFFSDVATAQKSDSDLKVGVEKNPSNGKGTVYFYGNNLSNNHRISSQDIHNSVKQSGLTMSDFATAYKQANSSNTDLKVGIKNGQLAFFGKHIYGGVQLVSSIVSGGGAKALANYGQAYKVAFDNKITLGYDKTWNNFVFYDSKQHMETGRVNINAGNSNAIAAFGNRYKAVLASGTDVKFTEDGKHLVGKNIDGKIDITTGIFANGDTNISKLKEFLNYYKQLEGTDLKIRQQMGNGGSWNDHFNVVGGNIVNAKGEAGCASWNSVFDGKGKTGFIAQYKLIQGGDTNICVGNGGVPTGYYDSKSKSMLKDGSGNSISYKTDTDTLSILKEKRVQECRNKSNSVDMNDPKQIKEFFEFCGYNPDLIFQACDTNGDGKLTGNEAKKYDDLYTNGDDSIYNHDDTTHDQHRLAEGRRSYINDSENSDIFPGKNVDEKYSSLTIDGSGAIIDSNGNGYMPVIVTDKGNDTGEVGKVEMRTFDASTSSVIHGPYGDSVVYGYVTEIDNGKGESVPIIRRDFTGDHAGESIGFLMDDRSSIFEQGSDGSNGSGSGGGSMQSVLTAGVIKGNDKDGWTLSGAGSYFSIVDGEAKIIGNGTRALEGSEIGLTATDAEGNEHSSTVRVTSNSCYVFTENGWESDTGESSFEFLGTPEENRAFVEASFYQATGDQIKDGELDNFNFTGTYKGSFYNVAGIMNQEGVKSFIVEGFYGADGKDGPKALESTTFEVSVVDINGGMFSFKCTQDTEFAVPEDYIDDIGSETFTIEEGGYATMAYYLAQHPEKTITVNGEELSGSAVYSEYGPDNKPAEGAVVVGYMYSLNKPITCTSENGYISQDVLDQTKGDVKWEKGSLVSVDFGKGTFTVTVGVLSVDGLTLSAEEFNKLTGNKGDGEEENQEQNEQDKGIINLNPFFKSAGITQEGNNVKISGTFYCVSGNTTVNGLVAALYAPKSTLNKEDLTPGGADVDKVDESGKPTGEKTGSSKFDNEVTVGKNGEWEINDAKFEWNWDLFDPNSDNSKKFNNYLGFTGGQIYAGVESLVINSPIVVLADFVNTTFLGNESVIEEKEREITRLAYGVDTTNQEYAAQKTQQAAFVSAVAVLAAAITIATLGEGAGIAAILLTTAMAAADAYFATTAANAVYNSYQAWQNGTGSFENFAMNVGCLALLFIPGVGECLGVTAKITMTITKSVLTKTATKAVMRELGKETIEAIGKEAIESAVKTSIEGGVEKGVTELVAKGVTDETAREALTKGISEALTSKFGTKIMEATIEGGQTTVLDSFLTKGFNDGMKALETAMKQAGNDVAKEGILQTIKKDINNGDLIKNAIDYIRNIPSSILNYIKNTPIGSFFGDLGKALSKDSELTFRTFITSRFTGAWSAMESVAINQFGMGFGFRDLFGVGLGWGTRIRNIGFFVLHNSLGMINSGKHMLRFIAFGNEFAKDVLKPLRDYLNDNPNAFFGLGGKIAEFCDILMHGLGDGERGFTDTGIEDMIESFRMGAMFYWTLPLFGAGVGGFLSGSEETIAKASGLMGDAGRVVEEEVAEGTSRGFTSSFTERFYFSAEREFGNPLVSSTEKSLSFKERIFNSVNKIKDTTENIFIMGSSNKFNFNFKIGSFNFDGIWLATMLMAALKGGARSLPVEKNENVSKAVKEYESGNVDRANELLARENIKIEGNEVVIDNGFRFEIPEEYRGKGEAIVFATSVRRAGFVEKFADVESTDQELLDANNEFVSELFNVIDWSNFDLSNVAGIKQALPILETSLLENIKGVESLDLLKHNKLFTLDLENNLNKIEEIRNSINKSISDKNEIYTQLFKNDGILSKKIINHETQVSILKYGEIIENGEVSEFKFNTEKLMEDLKNEITAEAAFNDLINILSLSKIPVTRNFKINFKIEEIDIYKEMKLKDIEQLIKDNVKNIYFLREYIEEGTNGDIEKIREKIIEKFNNGNEQSLDTLKKIVSLSAVSAELYKFFKPSEIVKGFDFNSHFDKLEITGNDVNDYLKELYDNVVGVSDMTFEQFKKQIFNSYIELDIKSIEEQIETLNNLNELPGSLKEKQDRQSMINKLENAKNELERIKDIDITDEIFKAIKTNNFNELPIEISDGREIVIEKIKEDVDNLYKDIKLAKQLNFVNSMVELTAIAELNGLDSLSIELSAKIKEIKTEIEKRKKGNIDISRITMDSSIILTNSLSNLDAIIREFNKAIYNSEVMDLGKVIREQKAELEEDINRAQEEREAKREKRFDKMKEEMEEQDQTPLEYIKAHCEDLSLEDINILVDKCEITKKDLENALKEMEGEVDFTFDELQEFNEAYKLFVEFDLLKDSDAIGKIINGDFKLSKETYYKDGGLTKAGAKLLLRRAEIESITDQVLEDYFEISEDGKYKVKESKEGEIKEKINIDFNNLEAFIENEIKALDYSQIKKFLNNKQCQTYFSTLKVIEFNEAVANAEGKLLDGAGNGKDLTQKQITALRELKEASIGIQIASNLMSMRNGDLFGLAEVQLDAINGIFESQIAGKPINPSTANILGTGAGKTTIISVLFPALKMLNDYNGKYTITMADIASNVGNLMARIDGMYGSKYSLKFATNNTVDNIVRADRASGRRSALFMDYTNFGFSMLEESCLLKGKVGKVIGDEVDMSVYLSKVMKSESGGYATETTVNFFTSLINSESYNNTLDTMKNKLNDAELKSLQENYDEINRILDGEKALNEGVVDKFISDIVSNIEKIEKAIEKEAVTDKELERLNEYKEKLEGLKKELEKLKTEGLNNNEAVKVILEQQKVILEGLIKQRTSLLKNELGLSPESAEIINLANKIREEAKTNQQLADGLKEIKASDWSLEEILANSLESDLTWTEGVDFGLKEVQEDGKIIKKAMLMTRGELVDLVPGVGFKQIQEARLIEKGVLSKENMTALGDKNHSSTAIIDALREDTAGVIGFTGTYSASAESAMGFGKSNYTPSTELDLNDVDNSYAHKTDNAVKINVEKPYQTSLGTTLEILYKIHSGEVVIAGVNSQVEIDAIRTIGNQLEVNGMDEIAWFDSSMEKTDGEAMAKNKEGKYRCYIGTNEQLGRGIDIQIGKYIENNGLTAEEVKVNLYAVNPHLTYKSALEQLAGRVLGSRFSDQAKEVNEGVCENISINFISDKNSIRACKDGSKYNVEQNIDEMEAKDYFSLLRERVYGQAGDGLVRENLEVAKSIGKQMNTTERNSNRQYILNEEQFREKLGEQKYNTIKENPGKFGLNKEFFEFNTIASAVLGGYIVQALNASDEDKEIIVKISGIENQEIKDETIIEAVIQLQNIGLLATTVNNNYSLDDILIVSKVTDETDSKKLLEQLNSYEENGIAGIVEKGLSGTLNEIKKATNEFKDFMSDENTQEVLENLGLNEFNDLGNNKLSFDMMKFSIVFVISLISAEDKFNTIKTVAKLIYYNAIKNKLNNRNKDNLKSEAFAKYIMNNNDNMSLILATAKIDSEGKYWFATSEEIETFEELFGNETEETKNLSGWKNFDYNRFIELYKSGNKDEMLNMLKQADLENSKLYEKILSDDGIKKSTVEEVKTAAEEKGIFTNTNIENKFNKNLTTEQQILLGQAVDLINLINSNNAEEVITKLAKAADIDVIELKDETGRYDLAKVMNMVEVSLKTDNADEVVTTLAEVANVDVNEFKDETGKYDLAKVMNVVQASLINNAEEVITTLAEAANVDVNKLKDENGKYDLAKVVDMLQTLQSEEIVTSGIKGETISTVYSLCKLLKKQEGKISQEKLKQAVARYQNSKSLTNITDILIDTLDNIDADGKELVKVLTGVTKPEEMQHAIAAVIAICQDADGIARLLGFDNIADVANVKNNEEIVNRFMLEVSEVADYEYAQEDKIATILLLSAARDILIAYNNKEIDEETINNGTIEDIQVAIQLSKAVNMNVIVKGLADAVVNKKVTIEDEEFKIDLVALQEAVTDKVKIKSILKNAKDSLEDLGNLGRGMATEKDLPDSLKALMNISDVHAVAASA